MRKAIVKNKPIVNQTVTGSFASEPINIAFLDNYAFTINWSGGPLVGSIEIDVTMDEADNQNVNANWVTLEFASPITITGVSGQHYVTVQNTPAPWARLRFEHTSGSGVLTVNFGARME